MPIAGARRFFEGNDEDDDIDDQGHVDVIVITKTKSGELDSHIGVSRPVRVPHIKTVRMIVELCVSDANDDIVEHSIHGVLEGRKGCGAPEKICSIVGSAPEKICVIVEGALREIRAVGGEGLVKVFLIQSKLCLLIIRSPVVI